MIFTQVMEILPWRRFLTCVNRYHGAPKTHTLTTQEFLKIMAFAQLTGRESLRETILCLNAVPAHLYHLGLPTRLRGCLEIKCLKTRVATIAVFWVFVKTSMFFWETAFV